ncbi:MAG: sodium:proton antiporter [Gammaproteobacteria bacterium]|uniref:Na+/H+ antiporter NhaD type n=1 Tax=Marinobacter nitratireducens TaxID=1137280 RepID=A0A072N0B6_9GAMM|nr:sodium:proton antiporter NhaD [Marinobacter nitratireducens]KEF30637.1 Na+/H+ antiporter NhaD type [Marinobacter nitratireducens]TNE71132.1 MAG: sodium:proton antiporter [Gammaproteobacteria bacterium]TNE99470.1 MAG: sodium:proton antiporter [Gammaproteobacteria bacterium]
MSALEAVLIIFAVLALLGVIFEEVTHVNKAKVTLFFGTLSWILLFLASPNEGETSAISTGLTESIAEIAGLWLFLVAAMTFVAYLNKKGMIENLIYLIMPKQVSERKLLFLTGLFCFIFSSLADNITATLVSCSLILSLDLELKKRLQFVTLVVFAVNSGGVSLITGDVTTLMIFLAKKVEILTLLTLAIPASITVFILAVFLSRGLTGTITLSATKSELRPVDITIAGLFLLTILSTIAGNALFSVPPVLTFLFGMSVMFLVSRFMSNDSDLDPILEYIRIIEFETLLFFLGILLLVGMLKEIHALDSFVAIYDLLPPLYANYLMGIFSAVIDNVPLTAALLKAGITMTPGEWMGLTYAVGVGGSLLVIGSAAGIVAMSKIPGLTFGAYLKYVVHLLAAYTLGYAGVYILGTFIH